MNALRTDSPLLDIEAIVIGASAGAIAATSAERVGDSMISPSVHTITATAWSGRSSARPCTAMPAP